MSDVILLKDVNQLYIFKENRAKWLLIMQAKSCHVPPVGIIFSLFFSEISILFPAFCLLFGTTTPYFFSTFCWIYSYQGAPQTTSLQCFFCYLMKVEFFFCYRFLLISIVFGSLVGSLWWWAPGHCPNAHRVSPPQKTLPNINVLTQDIKA